MVRHERRSRAANALRVWPERTVKTRSLRKSSHHYWLAVIVCLSALALHVPRFVSALDAEALIAQSAGPKFGERLMPRKKNVNAHVGRSGVKNLGYGHSVSNPATDTSVNSLLNRSNYIVSLENDDAKIRQKSDVIVGDRDSHSPEAFTLAVETLDDRAQETITMAPRPRKGKQLNRREDVNVVDTANNLVLANVSKADRLVEMSTEFFLVPTSSTHSPPSTPAAGKVGPSKGRGLPNFIQPSISAPTGAPRSVLIVAPKSTLSANNYSTPPSVASTHPSFTGLRKEPWVVPVLVLASLTMLMMGAFEMFVLFKAWRTSPSRRHLFLGQMLLLGLFACAGLGAIITAQPSLLSCGTIRFGVGVSYALVFAALLVKCVFLISLNGGVYLPAPYQGLLLLFAVLIQVAIGAQWLITSPPELFTLSVPLAGNNILATSMPAQSERSAFSSIFQHATNDVYARVTATGTLLIPLCKTQFSEFLFSLIYIVFLIVFVAVLAVKSRGIRDNYREATYIGLAIGGAIPIWLGWMLCGLAVAERHKDACIAFGLVATSATVFLVMFMPKGRQLAAMGKEGLYVEDREEQFSSLSRGGSGYSPSFFHFKPIKYGVMSGGGGAFQNSASNSGNGVNMKHSPNPLNAGGKPKLFFSFCCQSSHHSFVDCFCQKAHQMRETHFKSVRICN